MSSFFEIALKTAVVNSGKIALFSFLGSSQSYRCQLRYLMGSIISLFLESSKGYDYQLGKHSALQFFHVAVQATVVNSDSWREA